MASFACMDPEDLGKNRPETDRIAAQSLGFDVRDLLQFLQKLANRCIGTFLNGWLSLRARALELAQGRFPTVCQKEDVNVTRSLCSCFPVGGRETEGRPTPVVLQPQAPERRSLRLSVRPNTGRPKNLRHPVAPRCVCDWVTYSITHSFFCHFFATFTVPAYSRLFLTISHLTVYRSALAADLQWNNREDLGIVRNPHTRRHSLAHSLSNCSFPPNEE
jgi:hypothetical protein